ncbi:MAG: tRNA (adenosine(37)-N6)-threonylcarbamoyltransferase complex transferase subunit TsaD [bacterium]|nr:tRNA (adenosine(37)-N6)-threonylcarbamoyltransferase complex transferase subunit TsaD [bacterium]
MKTILAIDTSCDETSAAIVQDRRVLSHIEYSQIVLHQKWGGVVPNIAKRAHEERIDWVIEKALKNAQIPISKCDAIAVTYGPGLSMALLVGIRKAQELSIKFNIPLIGVNHMEGHLYSPFVQNSKGNPKRSFEFPYLGLLVSGAHTELVKFTDHLTYQILGETRDDAAGEALDKAARMLGFGYPGGATIEHLAREVNNKDMFHFPQPMIGSGDLAFSFSGLKTALMYTLKEMSDADKNTQLRFLASSFQEAIFQTLMKKTRKAILKTGITNVLVGGGVAVNERLRTTLRAMIKNQEGTVWYPPYKYLNNDNAAMIGLVGAIRAEQGLYVKDISTLDRVARLSLNEVSS